MATPPTVSAAMAQLALRRAGALRAAVFFAAVFLAAVFFTGAFLAAALRAVVVFAAGVRVFAPMLFFNTPMKSTTFVVAFSGVCASSSTVAVTPLLFRRC